MPSRSVEELILEQNNNIALLQQAISNYKKSPLDRKTEVYIQDHVNKIDTLWKIFEKLDNRFRNELPDGHQYLQQNQYTELGAKYNEIRSKMDAELRELRKPTINTCNLPTSIPKSPANREDAAIITEMTKQTKIISTVKCIINEALSDSTKSIHFYKTKLKIIEQHWKHAVAIHERLFESPTYNYENYILDKEIVTNGIIQLEEMITNERNTCTNNSHSKQKQQSSFAQIRTT